MYLIASNTYLSGTDLREAKNLTSDRVKKARNWEEAIYDNDFSKKLGLPNESEVKP